MAVVISHYFGVFWLNRPAVEAITNTPALPWETHPTPLYISWIQISPIFDWGAYGVALFFIISGFVIPFSINKVNWIGFAASRMLRIFPTYMFGFSITLLAIMLGGIYFSKEWPFTYQEILIHYIPGARDVMWSRMIDGIVWTLEIEIKFYLLCIFLIVLIRGGSVKIFFAPILLFVVAFFLSRMMPVWAQTNPFAWRMSVVYMTSSQFIIYMFIGVVFNYLYRGLIDAGKAYLGIGALFALFCIQWLISPNSASIGLAWSYAFALLTFSFAYSFPGFFKSNIVFDFMARISYPLYVIHGVAGYVALRVMLDMQIKAWLALLTVTAVCIFMSWIVHVLVEAPSQDIGKRLAARLTGAIKQTGADRPAARPPGCP